MKAGRKAAPHLERLSSGAFSARVYDPIKKRRVRITDQDELKVQARVAQIEGIKTDFKFGAIGPREAEREIAKKVHGAPTVEELWRAHEETLFGHHQSSCRSMWRARLAPAFGGMRVFELTPDVMARWEKSQLKKGMAPKSIQNAFWTLKAAVRAAIPHRVQEIPWRNWRPRPPPAGEHLETRQCCRSPSEVLDLVRAARVWDEAQAARSPLGYSDAAVRILFLLFTGARQSEAAALGWDHVTLDPAPGKPAKVSFYYATKRNWQIDRPDWTRPLEPPKMNKRRALVIQNHVVIALRAHKEHLERQGWYRPDGPVFPDHHGQWRKRPGIIKCEAFRQIVELAGLPNPERWVVHSTRHSFGTLESHASMRATGDVRGAMIRGGWSKLETMLGYMKNYGRGDPQPFMEEMEQGEIPGLLGPGERELRMLDAHKEKEQASQAMVLEAEARAIVVPGPEPTDAALTIQELAAKYKTDKELPPAARRRAKQRYSVAYTQAKRAGKTEPEAAQAGQAAQKGFTTMFRGMQKKARKGERHEG